METELKHDFSIYGRLKIKSDIYYKYNNLNLDHHRLCHQYEFLDENGNLFHKVIMNKTNVSELDFDQNIMLVKNEFYVKFKGNYNKITVKLFLHRVFKQGVGTFYLENTNENFCNNICLEKTDVLFKIDANEKAISSNLEKIDMNTDNISSNLGIINTNKSDIKNNDTDIAYNLKEINFIENDISKLKSNKIYLKNLDNLTLRGYNYTISYNQAIPFYKKLFMFHLKK